jgi:hypothetical protein
MRGLGRMPQASLSEVPGLGWPDNYNASTPSGWQNVLWASDIAILFQTPAHVTGQPVKSIDVSVGPLLLSYFL